MNLVPRLSLQCLGPAIMLASEALHEKWAFGHLSSCLFRS